MRAVDWDKARGVPLSGGFLHCCTQEQLGFVLSRHFAGVDGLVVVVFESEGVAGVEWVESEPGLAPFPHLFGSIPPGAVLRVVAARA